MCNHSKPTRVAANGQPRFVDGEIQDVTVEGLACSADLRGWLMELYRVDELPEHAAPVMAYVSETAPGVVRGPHEHRDQTDCFVFFGPGRFVITLWDTRRDSPTHDTRQRITAGALRPTRIIVPPGVVHAYQNVSSINGWVMNFPNRLFRGEGRRDCIDEIRHETDPHSPYTLD